MKIPASCCHFSFDLWLTLIRSNPAFKAKRNALFKSFFAIGKPLEEVARVIRHHDILANKISEITGQHIHAERIYCQVLHELKVNVNELSRQEIVNFQAAADQLFMHYKPVLINSSIRSCFQAIKAAGKTISILSNTAFINGVILRKLLDHYELSALISFQLYSDETGFSKPAAGAFDLVFRHATAIRPLNKTDILHIGDNPAADYQGAINYGFKAMLI
ncbi:putative hydrolase of the HAD superfamily [Chitinophaga rupis]|uniref:Putative hydrolase of the HAD superfamily n=1 Tax=Chitinophaga rupis TaxID=573321 RepID=A0A1H7R715_9BACT|nr:HAD family hydrolase [Chitinophaga rupis]SEL55337.1 putative hydrolase of the HAD superfamily [Chitinophaga rupis]